MLPLVKIRRFPQCEDKKRVETTSARQKATTSLNRNVVLCFYDNTQSFSVNTEGYITREDFLKFFCFFRDGIFQWFWKMFWRKQIFEILELQAEIFLKAEVNGSFFRFYDKHEIFIDAVLSENFH